MVTQIHPFRQHSGIEGCVRPTSTLHFQGCRCSDDYDHCHRVGGACMVDPLVETDTPYLTVIVHHVWVEKVPESTHVITTERSIAVG